MPRQPKPAFKVGDLVDYHAVIGGPITQFGLKVRNAPAWHIHTWIMWLEGKSGCVACAACTPAARAGAEEGQP